MNSGQLFLSETGFVSSVMGDTGKRRVSVKATFGALDALAAANMIIQDSNSTRRRLCTLTGLIYAAVASNFAEPSPVLEATGTRTTYVANTAFIMM